MTFGKIASLLGVAVAVLIVNVAASVLYMVVYAHVINPGHGPEYYQDHIQIAAPYCSIICGIPIMFAAGWWVAGWWRSSLGARGAIGVWLTYTVIDLSVLLIAGLSLRIGILFVVSFATKFAAVFWGAATQLKNHTEPPTSQMSPSND